jgi:hypothetical protein
MDATNGKPYSQQADSCGKGVARNSNDQQSVSCDTMIHNRIAITLPFSTLTLKAEAECSSEKLVSSYEAK